jgi:hypothetical protein
MSRENPELVQHLARTTSFEKHEWEALEIRGSFNKGNGVPINITHSLQLLE